MLLSEAKEFFMGFGGFSFHMWREEPEKYKEFEALNIDDDTKEEWRQEIIRHYVDEYYRPHDENRRWSLISTLIDVLFFTDTNKEENGRVLLDILSDGTESLDNRQKILTMESMAGRNSSFDGGIKWICLNTDMENEMIDILRNLVDFEPEERSDEIDGWAYPRKRYMSALSDMDESIKTYGRNHHQPLLKLR